MTTKSEILVSKKLRPRQKINEYLKHDIFPKSSQYEIETKVREL